MPDVPTSAAAADVALCHSPYANWSAHGEWCDFSAPAGPTLQGVYFADSSDCSTAGVGYGATGTVHLADGATCHENADGTSSRYKCVVSVCATGDGAFCSSSYNDCHLDGASDTPTCHAGYVAGPSPDAPHDSSSRLTPPFDACTGFESSPLRPWHRFSLRGAHPTRLSNEPKTDRA